MYLGDTKATKSFILWKQVWCFITQVTDRNFKPSVFQRLCVVSILRVYLSGVSDQEWALHPKKFMILWSCAPSIRDTPSWFISYFINFFALSPSPIFLPLSPRNGSTQEMGTCSSFYSISLPSLKFLSWWCQLITLLEGTLNLLSMCTRVKWQFSRMYCFSRNCNNCSSNMQLFKHLNLIMWRFLSIIFVSGFSHP